MPQTYDPYTQERMSPSFWRQVWDTFNPVDLMWYKYTMSPSVWNPEKGLWIPGQLGMLPSRLGASWDIIKNKQGIGKGLGYLAKNIWRGGEGQTYFWGEKFLQGAAKIRGSRQAFQTMVENETFELLGKSKAFKGGSWIGRLAARARRGEASKTVAKGVVEMMDEISWSAKSPKFAKAYKNFVASDTFKRLGIDADEFIKLTRPKGDVAAAAATRWYKAAKEMGPGTWGYGAHGKMFSAGAARGALRVAKWGVRINLALTAWDLTMMVGEPLGRWLVQEADNLYTRYANRFMPETGGRVAMSYMTTGAHTERQRAVQAISKAYINGRSALGNESEYFHG